MVLAVYTSNVIYLTKEADSSHLGDDKTIVKDCKIEQTAYGSVKIVRETNPLTVELYPMSINHIIHS